MSLGSGKNAEARDQACRRAEVDYASALAMAREIENPWYRCQALASVARFAPEESVEAVAAEAVASVESAEDPFNVSAVAAWPMRALIERGHVQQARELLPALLARAETIEHPVNRMDALFLLLHSVFPAGQDFRSPVLKSLLDACKAANSWKAGRTLRDTVEMLASYEPDQAQQVLAAMPDGKYKRQTKRNLAAGKRTSPRPFFWKST